MTLMRSSSLRRYCFGLLVLLIASTSSAATPCPAIRPPGLSPDQIDAVVIQSFYGSLRRAIADDERNRTIKEIDGTENAILTYSFGVLDIGYFLGFDAVKVFGEAAQTKGNRQPFETMTVAEMQRLARAAYAAGHDAPYPLAVEGAHYPAREMIVGTPSPAAGWSLMRCLKDTILFVREDGQGGINAKANASVVSLPPAASEAAFLKLVDEKIVRNLVGEDFKMASNEVKPTDSLSPRCVDFQLAGTMHDTFQTVIGRICQAAKLENQAYLALYAHVGEGDLAQIQQRAHDFIEQVTLRPH